MERSDQALRILRKIDEHLTKARRKHPIFCLGPFTRDQVGYVKDVLGYLRKQNDRKDRPTDALSILREEVFEMEEAYLEDRPLDAVGEAFDAIVVLLRMIEEILIPEADETDADEMDDDDEEDPS